MLTKKCPRCGEEKPLDCFGVCRRARDGKQSRCKPCHVSGVVASQRRNPKERKEANRRYYRNHYEKVRAYGKKYSHSKYYANIYENRERARLARATEHSKALARAWNASPAGQVSRANKKARRRLAIGVDSVSVTQWTATVAIFGGQCAYCGSQKKITADHFVPLARGGKHSISNMVPACLSCNSSKRASDPFEWMESRSIDADGVVAMICEAAA